MRWTLLVGLLVAGATAGMLTSSGTAGADILGQDVSPGDEVVGTVTRLEYDENGALIAAVITDKKGNRFWVFDGMADNDLQKYGAALQLAFAAGATVVLQVEDGNDVTSVQLRRKKGGKGMLPLPEVLGLPGG